MVFDVEVDNPTHHQSPHPVVVSRNIAGLEAIDRTCENLVTDPAHLPCRACPSSSCPYAETVDGREYKMIYIDPQVKPDWQSRPFLCACLINSSMPTGWHLPRTSEPASTRSASDVCGRRNNDE